MSHQRLARGAEPRTPDISTFPSPSLSSSSRLAASNTLTIRPSPPSEWSTDPFLVRRGSAPHHGDGLISPRLGHSPRLGSRPSSPERKRLGEERRRTGLTRLNSPALALVALVVFGLTCYATGLRPLAAHFSPRSSNPFPPTSQLERRQLSTEIPFLPSSNPLPVHHEEQSVIYHNHPLSPHRPPPTQFTLAPGSSFAKPVVALITATNNPRPVMRETAISLWGQSMQNFQWIIVDDHTDNPESVTLLAHLALDPRVHMLSNRGHKGLAQGRNIGLQYLLEQDHIPPYIVPIDDDDLFEMTALEKVVWLLESNPYWSLGGFPFIKWGATNETVWTGVHSGVQNFYKGNFVPNAAMYRTAAIVASGCRYDEVNFMDGGEDWDFWMCLAEAGHWGGSVPEPLYWYRMNPSAFRSSRWGDTFSESGGGFMHLRDKIHNKHAALKTPDRFPHIQPQISVALENITWSAPFDNLLAHHEKTIMFIAPWLYLGGADIGFVHMVQMYAELGYRVTVVCTLWKDPEGLELRPMVLQWTHDVHVLPSFLRARDMPRYLKQLILSRGIDDVVFSNSQLIYEMLPALVEEMPHVRFIDYLHNESYDGWKSGGYPVYSIVNQRYLARTITCSSYLRDWLIERGHDAERIGVVQLGIEMADYFPVSATDRAAKKGSLLAVDPNVAVVTFVGRLDKQKRPMLLLKIVEALKRLDDVPEFQLVVLGDGPWGQRFRMAIDESSLETDVMEFGAVPDPQPYLQATDIFLLPSMSEGISIAVAEAMAMGIPTITSLAGALPEQLGANTDLPAGILVNHTLIDDLDAELYAKELRTLLVDEDLRRELGANARKTVATDFDWRATLKHLVDEVGMASNLPRIGSTVQTEKETPHPAVYTAIQTLLLEQKGLFDFALGYGKMVRQQ